MIIALNTNYWIMKFFWTRFLFTLVTLTRIDLHAQVVGGRDNSEMTPKVAEAANLSGGGFVGDVNIMTGEYAASIPFGRVFTPRRLSFFPHFF